MDNKLSDYSRATYEAAAVNEKEKATFLTALEKEVSRRWHKAVMDVAEKIASDLNSHGHRLVRLDDHILAFGDIRPESEPSLVIDIFATLGVSAKAEKPEIRQVPAREKWYLETVDSIFAKFLADGYEALTPDQRIIHNVDQLDREVNNGGFSQYFFNSAGRYAHETLDALKLIGARKIAKMLEEAIGLFDGGLVPKEDGQREQALEMVMKENEKKLDRLASRYYKGADDIMSLLYIRFGGEG